MAAALLIAVANSALGQGAPRPVDLPPIAVHTRSAAPSDRATHYGIWAAGSNYKASFENGMRFVPYLGRNHTTTESLGWRTLSAAFGRQVLQLEEQGSVGPTLCGDYRVEYRFAGITEAYDIRPEGLEQTFVIHRVPAAGDFVVRGRIHSTLHTDGQASLDPTHRAIPFYTTDGATCVEYGAATAVDATGRRLAMTTSIERDIITLRLDGAWLAEAALPVVVDPLITTEQIHGDDVRAVDIAYDHGGDPADRIWVGYERAASAVDSDIVWLRVSEDASTTTLAYADITSGWSSEQPAVAFVGHAAAAILVFTHVETDGSRSVRWVVRGRTLANAFLPETAIPAPAGANDWRPDVGGALAGAPDRSALVVFQREQNVGAFQNTDTSLVMGQWIDVGANNPSSATWDQVVIGGGGFDNERPSINQTGEGTPDHAWLIAFQQHLAWPNPATANWDLAVRKASRYGLLTPISGIPAPTQRHDLAPQVAGSNGRFAIAFASVSRLLAGPKPPSSAGDQVCVQRLDWPGIAPWPNVPHARQTIANGPTVDLELDGLSFERASNSHWLALTRAINSQQYAITSIGHTGSQLRTDALPAGGGTTPLAAGAICDCAVPGMHLAALDSLAGNGLLLGRAVLPTPPAPTNHGTSCSPAGIGWLGPQWTGSEFSRVVVAGSDPNALHLLLVSTAAQSAPLGSQSIFAPDCRLLVDASPGALLAVMPPRIGFCRRMAAPAARNAAERGARVSGPTHGQRRWPIAGYHDTPQRSDRQVAATPNRVFAKILSGCRSGGRFPPRPQSPQYDGGAAPL